MRENQYNNQNRNPSASVDEQLIAAKEEIEFLHELIQSQRLYIQKLNEELDYCKEELVGNKQDLVKINKEVYEALMFNTALMKTIEKCNCLQHKREVIENNVINQFTICHSIKP